MFDDKWSSLYFKYIVLDAPITIYALSDPRRPSLIRYIGMTERPLQHRIRGHFCECLRKNARSKNSPKNVWIRSLLAEGVRPIIWPLEICQNIDGDERERFWIRLFRNLNGFLNRAVGGRRAIKPSKEILEARMKRREASRRGFRSEKSITYASSTSVPVKRIDTGETFPSMAMAAKSIGVNAACILRAIRNNWKSGGSKWVVNGGYLE